MGWVCAFRSPTSLTGPLVYGLSATKASLPLSLSLYQQLADPTRLALAYDTHCGHCSKVAPSPLPLPTPIVGRLLFGDSFDCGVCCHPLLPGCVCCRCLCEPHGILTPYSSPLPPLSSVRTMVGRVGVGGKPYLSFGPTFGTKPWEAEAFNFSKEV